MKLTTLLLTASVAANAALLAFLLLRPAPTAIAPDARPRAAATASAQGDALRAALASGDAAALAAAGLSPETIRELTVGRALARALDRTRAARASQPADSRWWRNRSGPAGSRELQLQNQRELLAALAAAGFEDAAGLFSSGTQSDQLAFLSPEKRNALRQVLGDYADMMSKFGANGIQLASDRERMKLLAAERERDIAALLSPAEFEAYQLRTSTTAANVRARYGDGIETEEDYRKIYALQKAFDDKYPFDPATGGRISGDAMRERSEAQRQLQDDLRTSLGNDKYAALRRASDSDLRNVDSLASRLNLPANTTDRVATSRDTLAAESQRINNDTSLTGAQRREQIQALGSRAKADLVQTLGAEAADAYAQRSPWVSMLQNGIPYSTTQPANHPGSMLGGTNIYPVPPAGSSGSGAVRQGFTIATPADFVGAVDPTALAPSGGVQVMTFSTSSSDPTSGSPATGTGQRVMVVPKPGTTTPTTPSSTPAP
ncbi:MAG: hypothetical protein V4773_10130 [Verrucomicrobiota bacterium]